MLRELLQVRRGESARASLLFVYLFLVIASSVVTKATRDPIFQEKFGSAQLPYVDMASAFSVAAVMGVYLRVSRRVPPPTLIIGTLIVSVAATIAFWFIARVREPVWMLPVLYVWASVAGVLLPAQVWTLANRVMTTREARRLFGIVSAGAISGWIVGGFVTRAIASRRGVADLLLPTAVALALCPFLVASLWRRRTVDDASSSEDRPGARGAALPGLRQGFRLIWSSPHLRAVSALIGISSLVTTIVGWQFKAVAHTFRPDTNQLAAFYGTFNIYAGMLALTTQLLIAPRLLRRFGLGVALLVVPISLFAGSLGLLLAGSLAAAVALKAGDQVVRYSIDRSTVEMLYLPVPAGQMAPAKALIDTVVWRLGDGLGALLVLVAVSGLGVSASRLSVLTLVLVLAWIVASIGATRHYVRSLRASLYGHRLDAERLRVPHPDRETTEALGVMLTSGEPSEILYALTLMEERELSAAMEHVDSLLAHPSPEVRRKTISVLEGTTHAALASHVEPLLHDPDQDVRAEALVFLAQCGHLDPLTQLGEVGDVQGSAVASAIAHFLARPGPAQNMDAVRVLLEVSTAREGPDREHARMEAARLIGSLPDQFEDQLNALLQDRSADVARLALRAAAAVGKASSIRLVVARLGDQELAGDAADALVAFGDRAVPVLRAALEHATTPTSTRHAVPDVLQRIATQEAEQVLVEFLLDTDPVLRLRTVSALNRLRQQHGNRMLERDLIETVLAAEIVGHYRSYQLLGRLHETHATDAARRQVRTSMDQEVERIFRLAKLLLPEYDLHSAYFGLQSANPVVRANALEFLEHALPVRLRTFLLPLLDSEVSLEQRMALADRIVGTAVETSEQALAAFAASADILRNVADEAERELDRRQKAGAP